MMDYIIATKKKYLARHAEIMELRFGQGMKISTIAKRFKCSQIKIIATLDKYSPKQTGRDVVLTIGSKLNYDNAPGEPLTSNSNQYIIFKT